MPRSCINHVAHALIEDVIDPDVEYRIDLADHPLYKALQQYVKANPR